MPDGKGAVFYLPKSYGDATYMINYALMRPHRVYGITLAAKNHYGSVYDLIASEPNPTRGNPSFNGNVDSYLHKAARANNPPSKATYDQEGDGRGLDSLGVHEHWNNATEKKYSRNLGKREGIELVGME